MTIFLREDVRNLILGYPTVMHKIFGKFFGKIHIADLEIFGYPRIPGYPLTSSFEMRMGKLFSWGSLNIVQGTLPKIYLLIVKSNKVNIPQKC